MQRWAWAPSFVVAVASLGCSSGSEPAGGSAVAAGASRADSGAAASPGTGRDAGAAPRPVAMAGTGGAAGGAGTGGQPPPAGASADSGGPPSGALDGGGADAAVDPGATGMLPSGGEGIAAAYPGDVGIDADPAVVFADDFESYTDGSELGRNWDAVYQRDQIRIAIEPDNVHSGAGALEFTVPQQMAELSNATDKVVSPTRDALFLRYYGKLQSPFDVVGSSHNGSMISAGYFIDGGATPGVPADGTNKFLVNLENWRGEAATPSPGELNVYVYHPEQRSQWGDHFFPSGVVLPNTSQPFDFGSGFVSREDLRPELDRWYCYEYMVRANTPGERDGRIAVWLDGMLVADFQNLRLRDVATLQIDRFGLSFHIGSNPNGETKRWYDDVVAATRYIGPRVTP